MKLLLKFCGYLLAGVLVSGWSGCSEKVNHKKTYRSGSVIRSDKDILVPKTLARKIERDFFQARHEGKKDEVKEAVPDAIKTVSQIQRKFLEIKVFLDSEYKGVLSSPTEFLFPRGGGIIDLSPYVNNANAEFNIRFEVKGEKVEEEMLPSLLVYYMSNYPKASDGHKSLGIGCNKYVDLSAYFHKKGFIEGLTVSARGLDYISVVGGTFYFIWPVGGVLHLGTVTFEDTRKISESCPLRTAT